MRVIFRRAIVIAVSAMLVATEPRLGGAEDEGSVQELRRELQAMKRRLAEVEDQTRKQEERIHRQDAVIEQLTGKNSPAATAAPVQTAEDEQLQKRVTENVLRRIQPSLAAANKTFASQFNPAIGFIIDSVGSYSRKDRANFEFRSGEIGISASIDPFARGFAILNGTPDGIEVEEAGIVTTSLPYNLTVKGGRFFADFGRLSKFHDHDLPFVNRPIVLDTYVGGESQGDGVETSWLVPIPHYLTLTAGAYNKVGAENTRVDNTVPRDFSQFTYLGRAATFFSLSDANSLDLGGSYAYTPEVKIENGSERHLAGLDLTYRYAPLGQAGYRGLIWGTEVLYNQENRPLGGFPEEPTDVPLDFKRRDRVGLYSYLEARVSRRLNPGILFEYAQDIDHLGGDTKAYSPYLTIWASEFQRFRLQYTRLDAPGTGGQDDRFFVQWTVILGSHVHSFRDR